VEQFCDYLLKTYIDADSTFFRLIWSEVIYAGKIAEYMIFPRICALAENLWLPPELKDIDDFAKRLAINNARLDHLGITYYRGKL
jgi:hexosaminidase